MNCKCGRPIYQRPNSTIIKKLCPKCTLKAVTKPETRQKTTLSKKMSKSMPKKKTSKNSLKIADLWFSRFIRVKHSVIYDGVVYSKDIITGKYYLANRLDNGHFYSRYHMATRFEANNCRPQNRSSNRFSGEADKFRFEKNLIAEIGQDEFDRITELAKNSSFKFGEIELKEIAKKYRTMTNELLKKKGGEKWW